MKKILYLTLFVITSFVANAQFTSDLVVFSKDSETFKLYLNSKLVNNSYVNKVRVNDLQSGEYKINIVFQSRKMPNLQQDIFIPENVELACLIVRGKYGVYSVEVFETMVYFDKQSIPILPVEELPNNDDGQQGVYCDLPMDDDVFATAHKTLKNKPFSNDKMEFAKQIATSNCLLSEHVKLLLMTFDFESDRLEFAKFAYTHTYDPSNYFVINDVFVFSSSLTELNNYINSIEE